MLRLMSVVRRSEPRSGRRRAGVAGHDKKRRVHVLGFHANGETTVELRICERSLKQLLNLVTKSHDAEKRSVLCENRAIEQERFIGRRLHEPQRRRPRNLARIARLPDRREPVRKCAGIDAEDAAVALRRDVNDRIEWPVERGRNNQRAIRSDETRLLDAGLP